MTWTEHNSLPPGWVVTRLAEIVETTSRRVSPIEFAGDPFIGLEHVEAHTMKLLGTADAATMKSSGVRFQRGDVLYGRLRPYLNKVVQPEFDGVCSAEFIVFPPDDAIDNRLLRYRLNASDFVVFTSGLNTGDRPRVDFDQLSDFSVLLPPRREQRRIVEEIEKQFTRMDAGVAALRRVEANLKRYKAAVLKAAVEGRLTARWRAEHPDTEPASELLQRILKERRRSWEQSELAKMQAKSKPPTDDRWKKRYEEPQGAFRENLPVLPSTWAWMTVEQTAAQEPNAIIDGPFGSNLKTEHYVESGPRVVRLQNIGDGEFRDEHAHISLDHFRRLLRHEVIAGDIVIAALGENPPRSCFIPHSLGPAIVKADCIRLRVNSFLDASFVNLALNADPTRQRTAGLLHGVGRPRLNLSEIKSIILPCPPPDEQKVIVAEVEERLSSLVAAHEAVTTGLRRGPAPGSSMRWSVTTEASTSAKRRTSRSDGGNTPPARVRSGHATTRPSDSFTGRRSTLWRRLSSVRSG